MKMTSNVCHFPLSFLEKRRSETYSEPSETMCRSIAERCTCGKGVAFLCCQRFDQLAARFSKGTEGLQSFLSSMVILGWLLGI